jgi:hypothetical protein
MLSQDRLLDLLAARATEGLSADETRELEQALAGQDALAIDDLEIAAAAVYLAFDKEEDEEMPEAVRQHIVRPGLP